MIGHSAPAFRVLHAVHDCAITAGGFAEAASGFPTGEGTQFSVDKGDDFPSQVIGIIADSAGIDVLIAADVLYDRENLSFLDTFFEYAPKVLLADSRIKDFQHPHYQPLDKIDSFTVPDLDEFDEFRLVSLYAGILDPHP